MINQNLHRQPMALDSEKHRNLKLRLPNTDWSVAKDLNAMFVAARVSGRLSTVAAFTGLRTMNTSTFPSPAPACTARTASWPAAGTGGLSSSSSPVCTGVEPARANPEWINVYP